MYKKLKKDKGQIIQHVINVKYAVSDTQQKIRNRDEIIMYSLKNILTVARKTSNVECLLT